jgi:hypothetical protein
MARATEGFLNGVCSAPKRGEIVREIGDELRATRPSLGRWSRLNGKDPARGAGEVVEMIDIADFAVGLAPTYGLTMHSERPDTACTSSGIRWDRGCDQRLQFPGGGKGMECNDRGGVRGSRAVAALP